MNLLIRTSLLFLLSIALRVESETSNFATDCSADTLTSADENETRQKDERTIIQTKIFRDLVSKPMSNSRDRLISEEIYLL